MHPLGFVEDKYMIKLTSQRISLLLVFFKINTKWPKHACNLIAIAMWMFLILFSSNVLASTEKDVQESIVKEEPTGDSLAPDMDPEKIKKRLATGKQLIDSTDDEEIRSNWTRITELLQMQLELLDALSEDFPSEDIKHPEGTPPFPLSYLDQIRKKYREYGLIYNQLEEAHAAAQSRIDSNEESYKVAKSKLNTLIEGGASSEERAVAEADFQLNKESFIYARLDARLINEKLNQTRMNVELFRQTIPKVEKDVVFSQQDHEIALKNIQEREEILKQALKKIQSDLESERKKPKEKQSHFEALESLQTLLGEVISYLHLEDVIWGERREIYLGEASTKKAVEWYEQNTIKMEEILKLIEVKKLGQLEHTQVLEESETKGSVVTDLVNVDLEKEILLRRQLAFDNLASIVDLLRDHLADLERLRGGRKFKFMQEKFLYIGKTIWNLQLAVVQDRTITVGKTVIAILVFVFGMVIAKWLVLRLIYFMLKQIGIREGVAYTVSQLLFYLTLLVLLFGAISYAGIPLHIFAFFGGALAIAAGFGSQKIISNFLSGVILLLEGSIRVADTVQVDEAKGRVKSIGLRHTRMTTFDNVDILIPNSKFLEETVINWTLESDLVRSNFAIGTEFTASPDHVMEILVQTALDNPGVENDPPPDAFLEQINNDAGYLRFNLYYWHEMKSPRQRLVFNSALQVEIINRLKTNGIELATPTQDVILHKGSMTV